MSLHTRFSTCLPRLLSKLRANCSRSSDNFSGSSFCWSSCATPWRQVSVPGFRLFACSGISGAPPRYMARVSMQHQHLQTRSIWQGRGDLKHFEKRGGGWSQGRMPWVVGISMVGFGAYYVSCLETVPYTGRRHSLMFVSRRQEKAMGKMIFEMEREKARQLHQLLPPSHPYSRLVEKTGLRVAAVASAVQVGSTDHMQHMDWEFAVIQSPIPNAFVVPGGKVVVYTGLLDLLASEDEVAAILAHETAHVLARHHAEKMSSMNLFALVRMVCYIFLGFAVPQSLILLGFALPYSRRAEYEADSIGLKLLALACYDPGAATSMLAKLNAKEKQLTRGMAIPAFMRTHPLTDDRVVQVKAQLPEAYTLYNEHCSIARSLFDVMAVP